MRLLLISFIFVMSIPFTQAAVWGDKNGIEVGPGTNPEQTITEEAEYGDRVWIWFKPKVGYRFNTKSDVRDPNKIGWKHYNNQDHAFVTDVTSALALKVFHTAQFYGELVKENTGGTGGDKPTPLPWDLTGKFKLVYDHEGVGADLGRKPPGTLKSSLPNTPTVTSGNATYNEKTREFDGTFEGEKFLGQYDGRVEAGKGTESPENVGKPQQKPCPEGDKVMVTFVYLGCNTSGKIGGMATPDTITINGFTPNPSLQDAQRDAAAKATAREQAQTVVTTVRKNVQKAEADLTKAKADLDKAIDNTSAVRTALTRMKTAETNLESAKRAKDAADKEMAIVEELVRKNQIGRNSNQYLKAVAAVTAAQTLVTQTTDQLVKAKDALAKAREAAAKDPTVIAAQKKVTDAETAVAQAKDALAKAEEALAAATSEAQKAEALVAKIQELLAQWKLVKQGTQEHEDGHRKICHHFANKMTDLLNQLQVWGYAPKEARARVLAVNRFDEEYRQRILKIIDDDTALQEKYDSPEGTDHGRNQKNWDWSVLK